MRRGLLRRRRDFGSGTAANIVAETRLALEDFSTELQGCPDPKLGAPRPKYNLDVYTNVTTVTRQVTVDSASNEVLAVRMQSHGERLDNVKTLTPNAHLIRDRTHGVRRFYTRARTVVKLPAVTPNMSFVFLFYAKLK